MSHTNSTTHYSLPQFVGTDTPGWLTDVNSAMSSIDSAIFARQQESVSNSDAITANTANITTLQGTTDYLSQSVTGLDTTVSGHTASIATLQTSVTQNTGDIAGLATRVTNLSGSDISYDSTGTDLTSANVQAAITELDTKIESAGGFTLLWTNPNPTTSSGDATLNLDLQGYTFIGIVCRQNITSSDVAPMNVILNNTKGQAFFMNGNQINIRDVTLTDTTLAYTQNAIPGVRFQNDQNVPYQIYGIK